MVRGIRFRLSCLFALIFSLIFLLNTEAYAQPTVDWSLSFPKAENVDVGSGKHANIELKFEMADAPVNGGIIKITIPNAPDDFYEASKPAYNAGGAGAIVLGSPTYSGGVLTFPATNFPLGKTLHYIIPHRAVDNLPLGVMSDQIQIEILDNTNTPIATGGTKTVNFNYRRANLTIVSPTTPATGQSGLTVNFGTNNGSHNPGTNTAQEYRFAVRTSNGSVDSLRVKFTLPTVAATITPGSWKANNVSIGQISSTVNGSNTTYTLHLTKAHSIGGDGFDDGEQVDISVQAQKSFCGNTTVNMSAAWGSSGDYVSSSDVPGSLSANSSIGSPVMARVSMAPITSNPWNTDGTTANEFITKAKNNGSADACDIVYNVWVFAWSTAPTFMDVNGQYSVDGGGTWNNITAEVAATRTSGTAQYRSTSTYVGKPYNIRFRIPENLPAGQEIHIKWKFYIAPDMYISDVSNRTDRDWLRLIRWDDSWSYTDLCRSATSNLQSQGIYSTAEYMKGTNYAPAISLTTATPNKNAMLHLVQFLALGDVRLTGTGKAVGVNLKLPKGVKIKNTGTYQIKFADSNGISGIWNYTSADLVNETGDPTYNLYSFKFTNATNATKYLFVEFELDCAQSPSPGLHDFEITYDLYPTSSVKMPETMKYYNQISLNCGPASLNYTWDIKRLTVGLIDADNNSIPESNTKITPAYSKYNDMDHKQMVCGDTLNLIFDGTVSGVAAGDEFMYAVVFSEVNHSIYQILNTKVSVTGTNTYQATFLNTNNSTPFPINGQLPPKKYAYVWKITKTSGGSAFSSGENVILTVPFKAVLASASYTPTKYKLGSWMYTSPVDLGTAVNFAGTNNPGNPGSNRHGDEEYGFTTMYFRGYHGGWSNSPTINFNGAQTKSGSFYINPAYGDYIGWTPYEFRTLATHDTIYVNVPDGYLIGNTMTFDHNGDNGTITIAYDPANSSKTRKAFPIKNKYIDSGAGKYITTATANTNIRIIEGQYRIQAYPQIISTPRTPVGTSQMYMTSLVDYRKHTHAYLNNSQRLNWGHSSLVFAEGAGVKLTTTDAASKNLEKERLTWALTLHNTLGSTINEMWLYVEGPVKNVKYNGITGVGDDGRWIKLNNVPVAGITDNLSFDVIPDNGCTNKTIKVYPIFNNTNPATFSPFGGVKTDAAFNTSKSQDGGDFDLYVYRELSLTINTVASTINGSITAWANTPSDPENSSSPVYGLTGIDKGLPFTVEVVFDASGSAGPVSKPSVSLDFPQGLEYHVDSAYIEYKGVSIKVTDPDWITNNLSTLSGTATAHNNMIFNLADLYDTQLAAMTNSFGDHATIEAGEKLYFRFKLRPTCDIGLTGERIGARFSGKRFCDFSSQATSNGQTVTSDQLTLMNPVLAFRSNLTFNLDKDSLVCESVTDTAQMTLTFQKLSKLAEAMQVSDSIKVALPLSLTLEGDIHYSFPAYGGLVSAETGTIPWSQIDSYVVDTVRYLSWQLPIGYYNNLWPTAESDKVTLSYSWNVKTGKTGLQYKDSAKVYIATRSAFAPHLTCPYTIIDADSIIKQVILTPAKIVTIPRDTGYVITDKYGKEVTATDTIIYNGDDFDFAVKLLYGYTQSIPTVLANSVTLTSVGHGNYFFNYKFSVLEDTRIYVYDIQLNRYTVYFDTDGGDRIKPVTVVHGYTVPKPSGKPKHDEYNTFYGWYSKEDTMYIEPWDFDTARVMNDTTIYALWNYIPPTPINRKITIPFVDGINSNPLSGIHYTKSGSNFMFSLQFSTAYPLKVMTGRTIEGKPEELFGTKNEDGEYVYIIRNVRSDISLTIGPDPASGGGTENETLHGTNIWSHNDKLYVALENDDIITIYSISGQLVKKLKLEVGTTNIPLERGTYVVTLLNANRTEKIIIH